MKRFLFILLAACCMLQVAWGQESSSYTLSPFVGEWSGNYSSSVYDEQKDDIVHKNLKLIVLIEQFGHQLGVRIKSIFQDGSIYYYWSPCTVTSFSESNLYFIEKTKEIYDSDDRSWYHCEKTYRLVYEQGRLHMVREQYKLYGRFPSGGISTKDLSNAKEDCHDIYLYPNSNW